MVLASTWVLCSLFAGHCLDFQNLGLPWYLHAGPAKPDHPHFQSQAYTLVTISFRRAPVTHPDFYWIFWNNKRRGHRSAQISKPLKVLLVTICLRCIFLLQWISTSLKANLHRPLEPFSPSLSTQSVPYCSSEFRNPHEIHLSRGQDKI